MAVKVTGQFEPAGSFSIVDGKDVSGNITGSAISASGYISASSFVGTLTGTATGLAGTPDITVGSLTATSITSSIVTSSIIYTEGSNIFGDASDDTHKFNGSITASGNISASGTIYAAAGDFGDGNISNVGSITLDSILPDNASSVHVGTVDGTVKLIVNGHIAGITKSFIIDHPTKPGNKLQYGSIESPNHSIRLTGKGKILKRDCVIQLPEYLHALVYEEGVNIQITNINHSKSIFIKHVDIPNDNFKVRVNRIITNTELEFFWTLTAERKDVPRIGE